LPISGIKDRNTSSVSHSIVASDSSLGESSLLDCLIRLWHTQERFSPGRSPIGRLRS
jgi:hypothetical protein